MEQNQYGFHYNASAVKLLVMCILTSRREQPVPSRVLQDIALAYNIGPDQLADAVHALEGESVVVCVRDESKTAILSVTADSAFDWINITCTQQAFFDTTPGTSGQLVQAYIRDALSSRFVDAGIDLLFARRNLQRVVTALGGYAPACYPDMTPGQRRFVMQPGGFGSHPTGLFSNQPTGPGYGPGAYMAGVPTGSDVKSYPVSDVAPLAETTTHIKGAILKPEDIRLLFYKLSQVHQALGNNPQLCDEDFKVTVNFKGIALTLPEVLEVLTILS